MKKVTAILLCEALLLATLAVFPVRNASADHRQYTKPAPDCVSEKEYAMGTDNSTEPFTRFYNTCKKAINLRVATPKNENLGPALVQPGSFLVAQWKDGVAMQTKFFACYAPGQPVKYDASTLDPPNYDAFTFDCLITK
jgi:hypothetical protein